MGKTIKFSDPRFFGKDFIKKYQEFKQARLTVLGDVDMRSIMQAVITISNVERPHTAYLSELAVATAKSLFPVIETANLQFDVSIEDEVSHNSIDPDGTPDFPEELDEEDDKDGEMFRKAAKQKILDAFGQGAAVSMNTIHHMVNELDEINPTLKENYDKLLKANEVAYLTIPEEDFARMAMMANAEGEVGGTNKVEFREHVPYVVAKAKNFVTLVHEIIKGLYTYLALNAYTDEFEYHQVSQYTVSIASEIEDIGCGMMILNLLRDHLLNHCEKYYVHESFFEMYFVAISKLPADEIIPLIHGLIKGEPNKAKLEDIARNCYYELKDFDKSQVKFD